MPLQHFWFLSLKRNSCRTEPLSPPGNPAVAGFSLWQNVRPATQAYRRQRVELWSRESLLLQRRHCQPHQGCYFLAEPANLEHMMRVRESTAFQLRRTTECRRYFQLALTTMSTVQK